MPSKKRARKAAEKPITPITTTTSSSSSTPPPARSGGFATTVVPRLLRSGFRYNIQCPKETNGKGKHRYASRNIEFCEGVVGNINHTPLTGAGIFYWAPHLYEAHKEEFPTPGGQNVFDEDGFNTEQKGPGRYSVWLPCTRDSETDIPGWACVAVAQALVLAAVPSIISLSTVDHANMVWQDNRIINLSPSLKSVNASLGQVSKVNGRKVRRKTLEGFGREAAEKSMRLFRKANSNGEELEGPPPHAEYAAGALITDPIPPFSL